MAKMENLSVMNPVDGQIELQDLIKVHSVVLK